MVKLSVLGLILVLLVGSTFLSITTGGTSYSHFSDKNSEITNNQYTQKIWEAASYIENRYDVRLGLVSESEDTGSNVPNMTPCNRTFWVYDDNLWSSEALEPFNLTLAESISATVARYENECGNSDLFEVVLGKIIPTIVHSTTKIRVDTFVFDGVNYTVWADRHEPQDGGIFFDADKYADLCFYLSLDYFLQGNRVASEQWFRIGESYWNGYGFLDKAANATGLYQNYKLGLYLFTAKATGFTSLIYDAVENVAWSYQERNGGIASLSYFNGTIYGTANVETTSILLLAYNSEALARFSYLSGLLIGAYYYPWYGIASNEHWDQGVKYMPLLGRYNSSDPKVADEQILLAKQHGIDFFAVSWIGEGTWHNGDFATIDQNVRSGLLQAPDMSSFKFCLFYETVLVKDNSFTNRQNFSHIFLNDINYAAQHYFSNPSYLKVNGSPVFFIYNVPYLYGNLTPPEVNETINLLDSARQEAAAYGFDLYIIGDMNGGPQSPDPNSTMLYSMNATTCYHFSDGSTSWDQVLGNAATYYPQWLSTMNSDGLGFVPDAYPGFDNTENCAYKNASGIPTNNGTVLPLNEMMFKQMLNIAINYSDNNPKIVLITSWNEWLESTAIEPSVENGSIFLDQVLYPTAVPEFSSTLLVSSFLLALVPLAAAYRKHMRKERAKHITR